jgi:tetratricopeptide (TPR) repeat protein
LEAASNVNAGVDKYQQRRFDEAKKYFLRAIELSKDPRLTAMAHINVGMVCNSQMQYAEAVTHFEVAVRLFPSDLQAKLDLGNGLLYTGRFAEALTVAKELVPHVDRMGKSKQSALTFIGNVQLTNADWAGAAVTFERIVREFPAFTSAFVGLGEALENQGKGPESVSAFRAALKVLHTAICVPYCNLCAPYCILCAPCSILHFMCWILYSMCSWSAGYRMCSVYDSAFALYIILHVYLFRSAIHSPQYTCNTYTDTPALSKVWLSRPTNPSGHARLADTYFVLPHILYCRVLSGHARQRSRASGPRPHALAIC